MVSGEQLVVQVHFCVDWWILHSEIGRRGDDEDGRKQTIASENYTPDPAAAS